jgi:TIR domain-containing protein
MAHEVFISYSSKDAEIATKVCAALGAKNITYWIATKDVIAGDMFHEAVLNGIEHCELVTLIFSSHADKSLHVKRKLQITVELNKTIIPFRVENAEPYGLRYYLTGVQWQTAPAKHLNESLEVLASTIQLRLQRRGPPKVTAEGVTRKQHLARFRKTLTASLIAAAICTMVLLPDRDSKVVGVLLSTPTPQSPVLKSSPLGRQVDSPVKRLAMKPIGISTPKPDPDLQARLRDCYSNKNRHRVFQACVTAGHVVTILAADYEILDQRTYKYWVTSLEFMSDKKGRLFLRVDGEQEQGVWPFKT